MSPAQFIDDPNWADFLPEAPNAPAVRALPAHEDCESVDPEAVAAHLRRGGTLGLMPGYEERHGQIDMARAIVRAYNAREHLMIEAGTGVGKSLAYLVPSILWAWTNDTPVVVSTATRNLQSQLVTADIPRALAVLGEHAAEFRFALLKGRANYLCLRAVADFFAAGYWTMAEDEQREMPNFIEWLRTTPDGDLDRYEGLPRNLLTCPGEECGGRRCAYYTRCFLYRARKAAAAANLVVANHALVLADCAAPGGALLPPAGRLVLDEAHNLEDVATDYLSREFSLPALTRLLSRLMRRGRGRRVRPGGILASVERLIDRGSLSNAVAVAASRMLTEASRITVRLVNAAEETLDLAASLLFEKSRREVVRYTGPLAVDGPAAKMDAEIVALVNLLHDLRDLLEDDAPPETVNPGADLAAQIGGIAESFVAFANDAAFVRAGAPDTHAFWGERVHPEKRPSYVRLVAAPLDVSEDLKKMIWDIRDSAILSSATLRVGNDFRYMMRRLGCTERFQSLTAPSPFDYLRQALVLAPDCLPDPSADAARYGAALAALLGNLLSATRGRGLVLFTSYEMMNAVAACAADALAESGIELIVQGTGLSREAMTRRLKEAPGGVVLFGAQSFWEGVDVAGEALSCVVIARLPFAQRADPIIEARSERIDRAGGSSFRDYYLPEAVIRFRQGFGRLIRTQRDRGVVVVTDPRLVTKNYGAIFRHSIPATVHTVSDEGDLLARTRAFFEDAPS